MPTPYVPESLGSREDLAVRLLAKMHECGFSLEKRERTNEAIYSRVVDGTDGKIRVMVYTTVVNGRVPKVRECGKDAIRVCAVYTSDRTGVERGLAKETRINRVGTIEDIVDRVYTRMRSVYGDSMNPCCCKRCGTPTFVSKNDNRVCADLCWKSDEELAAEARRPRRSANTRRPPARYRRRWRKSA